MCNGSVFSTGYERMIGNMRSMMIREALRNDKSVILDNVNVGDRHWESSLKLAREANKDVQVFEKALYEELDVLLERDAKRIGTACVGEKVVKKFFKDLGGKQFKFYHPRVEIVMKRTAGADRNVAPIDQNDKLERCVVFDNDGTISLLNGRNPYDASTCDNDLPHSHVIECMKLYHDAGYKILFVSGREEKDRAPTERFYAKHFPEVKYELYMRPSGDMRRDQIIKEEIFNAHIKDKYFVAGWFDDRLQICKWLYEAGFPLFRVNDPEATF
jgi:hypothetical protein